MSLTISEQLLAKYNTPVPRYTSYPPAHAWVPQSEETYRPYLKSTSSGGLYIHIPFCQSICAYCGCHSRTSSSSVEEETYASLLCEEMTLFRKQAGTFNVTNVHFGGGSPTKLCPSLLSKVLRTISTNFKVDAAAEYAIEIDPRTVGADGEKLRLLKELGFSRISLGFQDLDDEVQRAIGRNQKQSLALAVYDHCTALGFSHINIDLIYGLPKQTPQSFQKTISTLLPRRPSRISLFSFAYMPSLKANQRAINKDDLPSPSIKFDIFATARAQLIEEGYVAIGMDHFAREDAALHLCQKQHTLHRNFQGYTTYSGGVIGFGESAISTLEGCFFQNTKVSARYAHLIKQGTLPIERGIISSPDDQCRAFVINHLMCHFSLDTNDFFQRFTIPFDRYFQKEIAALNAFSRDGLLLITIKSIKVTELGKFFIRNIASIFDQYPPSQNASRTL